MKRYTVKKIAELSGVSVRTLHFYDEIGLLKPAFIGKNGYRYYEREQLLILQQVLFYRKLGFGLEEIQKIVTSPTFNKIEALQAHRSQLEKDAERVRA
jgi:DNA-binding transcriptional MerR regulator